MRVLNFHTNLNQLCSENRFIDSNTVKSPHPLAVIIILKGDEGEWGFWYAR